MTPRTTGCVRLRRTPLRKDYRLLSAVRSPTSGISGGRPNCRTSDTFGASFCATQRTRTSNFVSRGREMFVRVPPLGEGALHFNRSGHLTTWRGCEKTIRSLSRVPAHLARFAASVRRAEGARRWLGTEAHHQVHQEIAQRFDDWRRPHATEAVIAGTEDNGAGIRSAPLSKLV